MVLNLEICLFECKGSKFSEPTLKNVECAQRNFLQASLWKDFNLNFYLKIVWRKKNFVALCNPDHWSFYNFRSNVNLCVIEQH